MWHARSRMKWLMIPASAVAALLAASAAASPPTSASGTFTYTSASFNTIIAPRARAYQRPSTLNEVARAYSLGVGEVWCESPTEWDADIYSAFGWGYTNVRKEYAVLSPLACEGALNVASAEFPAWQRAVGTLVLVHEAFHLRRWRFRRDEGKVECQAIVYFTEAARKLGASEAEADNLYPYALAWHWRQTSLLWWYRDPKCVIPPWTAPTP